MSLAGFTPRLATPLAKDLMATAGVSSVEELAAMPIDDFVPEAIFRSVVGGKPDQVDPVHQEIIDCCAQQEPKVPVTKLIGADFYNRVKAAHTVVQTGEPRLYANVILRKGVIYP